MKLKEIVQALRCRARYEKPTNEGCKKCPYWATENLEEWQKLCGWASCKVYQIISDAADAIERLTAENADLRKELEWKGMVIALAQRKQAEAEAERDAAIVDLKIFAGCSACRHCCNHRRDHQESLLLTCCDCTKKKNCKCGSCSLGRSNWEWRGLPEEPEEGEKA
nr:MAG TPA: hypothetical protein [Caudoviricetes sp.]